MAKTLNEAVRARYSQLETDEIRERLNSGTLTEEAREIALAELATRGAPETESPEDLARKSQEYASMLAARNEKATNDVARGQKFVLWAVVIQVLAIGALIAAPELVSSRQVGFLVMLSSLIAECVAIAMGAYGILAIGSGLGWSSVARLFTFALMVVPPINLVTLLYVNGSASAYLKRLGYRVGLMGARKATP